MPIVSIENPADLRAGDEVVFAPFGMETFQNSERKLQEKDGDLGFFSYDDDGNEDKFFVAVTADGVLNENLVLVKAERWTVMFEKDENVGREIFSGSDLPEPYGVLVIVRHPEHGDDRGWASNDNVDGFEWINMVRGKGRGSFGFWRSGGYRIFLAEGLHEEYNL